MSVQTPFEKVVERHGPTVLRVCRAVVGPVDADDAWSETFLSALRAYPELPTQVNLEAWLVTIAHRRAIDLHRARGRRAVPVHDVGESAVRAEPGGDPAKAWESACDNAELYAALARLSDRQRQAVAYHHLAGLPHAEVAAIIGGTPAAVRRASADGIAALRRMLATDAHSTPASRTTASPTSRASPASRTSPSPTSPTKPIPNQKVPPR